MSVLLKPPFLGSGLPKIDLGGCVLYLPLWRQDMTGSPIISKDTYAHLCSVTGALWTPQGRDFDGTDDRISVPRDSSFEPASALTLESWSKSTTYDGTILDKAKDVHTAPHFTYALNHSLGSEKLNYQLTTAGVRTTLVSDSIFPLGVWIHVVATYNGSAMKLFFDGELDNETAKVGVITYYDTDLLIGELRNDPGYDFDGLIGEVRIYNRALSLPEIQHNYQATKWRYS